ncbi:2,3-diaminopropionate biosynthesis protein SbnA [Actinoplanes sichuanensis]|nr:2,3-diaminopropionate biosynthesis protein SbnA [Actinoplanes sichuanensis]
MVTAALSARLLRVMEATRPTPLIQLDHPTVNLFCKLESSNITGSTKDRSAYAILTEAVEAGLVTGRTTLVESSSGNFAVSLAMLCRLLGVPFIPVIDPSINVQTEQVLRAGCERVEKVVNPDGHGHLPARIDRVQQLRAQIPGAYWPNQYANPAAARGHFTFTGAELCADLPDVDYVFVGVGTGACLAGISQRVKQHRPRAKVIAVDVEGSVIFGGPAGRRRIPGIGSLIQPSLVKAAIVDEVVVVAEADTVRACWQLLRHGVHAGGSTGSVLAAINTYFADYRGPRPTVAFLCADRGSAYTQTIYNPRWVHDEFDIRVTGPDAFVPVRAATT